MDCECCHKFKAEFVRQHCFDREMPSAMVCKFCAEDQALSPSPYYETLPLKKNPDYVDTPIKVKCDRCGMEGLTNFTICGDRVTCTHCTATEMGE